MTKVPMKEEQEREHELVDANEQEFEVKEENKHEMGDFDDNAVKAKAA